jgi:hypothetical protein
MVGWHPDVDNGELGSMLTYEAQEHRCVAGLTDDAVPRLREQASEPFPEQEIVVSDDDGPRDPRDGVFVHGRSMRGFGVAIHFRLMLRSLSRLLGPHRPDAERRREAETTRLGAAVPTHASLAG